jgi:hypothetical protein
MHIDQKKRAQFHLEELIKLAPKRVAASVKLFMSLG